MYELCTGHPPHYNISAQRALTLITSKPAPKLPCKSANDLHNIEDKNLNSFNSVPNDAINTKLNSRLNNKLNDKINENNNDQMNEKSETDSTVDWSKNLKDFISKCLVKESCDRYSATELLDHIFISDYVSIIKDNEENGDNRQKYDDNDYPEKEGKGLSVLSDMVEDNLPFILSAKQSKLNNSTKNLSNSYHTTRKSHPSPSTSNIRVSHNHPLPTMTPSTTSPRGSNTHGINSHGISSHGINLHGIIPPSHGLHGEKLPHVSSLGHVQDNVLTPQGPGHGSGHMGYKAGHVHNKEEDQYGHKSDSTESNGVSDTFIRRSCPATLSLTTLRSHRDDSKSPRERDRDRGALSCLSNSPRHSPHSQKHQLQPQLQPQHYHNSCQKGMNMNPNMKIVIDALSDKDDSNSNNNSNNKTAALPPISPTFVLTHPHVHTLEKTGSPGSIGGSGGISGGIHTMTHTLGHTGVGSSSSGNLMTMKPICSSPRKQPNPLSISTQDASHSHGNIMVNGIENKMDNLLILTSIFDTSTFTLEGRNRDQQHSQQPLQQSQQLQDKQQQKSKPHFLTALDAIPRTTSTASIDSHTHTTHSNSHTTHSHTHTQSHTQGPGHTQGHTQGHSLSHGAEQSHVIIPKLDLSTTHAFSDYSDFDTPHNNHNSNNSHTNHNSNTNHNGHSSHNGHNSNHHHNNNGHNGYNGHNKEDRGEGKEDLVYSYQVRKHFSLIIRDNELTNIFFQQ